MDPSSTTCRIDSTFVSFPPAILFARCLQLRSMPWLMHLAYGEFELPNGRRGRKILLDGTTPPNRYRKILRASLILR